MKLLGPSPQTYHMHFHVLLWVGFQKSIKPRNAVVEFQVLMGRRARIAAIMILSKQKAEPVIGRMQVSIVVTKVICNTLPSWYVVFIGLLSQKNMEDVHVSHSFHIILVKEIFHAVRIQKLSKIIYASSS